MKRFLKIVVSMKEAASYCYSAFMCILLCALLCAGQREVSVPYLFSILLAAAAAGVLQVAAFTGLLVKKLAYGWRVLLFAVPYLGVLTALALCFGWFPAQYKGAWLEFGGIFLLILLFVSVGFEIYFWASGRRYDGLLGQYRQKKAGEKDA